MTVHSTIIVAEADAPVFPTLLRVLKLTRAYQNLRLAEIGLQNGQDEFLLALGESEAKCVCDLACDLDVRASTVSKMVDVLVAKGLVERASSDRDHRRILVLLTAAGEVARRTIRAVWDELDVELIQSAAAVDATTLRRQLQTLEEHVGKRLARVR